MFSSPPHNSATGRLTTVPQVGTVAKKQLAAMSHPTIDNKETIFFQSSFFFFLHSFHSKTEFTREQTVYQQLSLEKKSTKQICCHFVTCNRWHIFQHMQIDLHTHLQHQKHVCFPKSLILNKGYLVPLM